MHIDDVAVGFHTSDGFGPVGNCFHDFVGVCNGRVHYIFVLELHSVRESLASLCFDMACMRVIILWGCCNIPSIDGVICPRASFISLFVDLDCASHQR